VKSAPPAKAAVDAKALAMAASSKRGLVKFMVIPVKNGVKMASWPFGAEASRTSNTSGCYQVEKVVAKRQKFDKHQSSCQV
jgi:hypothetical protein